MALKKGNADCTAGLSQRIYEKKKINVESKDGWSDLAQADKDAILDGLKENAWAEAQAHIDEIDINAELESAQGTYILGTLIAGANPVTSVTPPHTNVAGGIK